MTPKPSVHANGAHRALTRGVVFGNQGVLQGISKGKCYVEMSTVDEETVQDVADAVMARGGTFLEAPVCGSRVPALEGQLIILTSGDRKLYDDCFSCFEAMGRKSFYLGNEVGTATRMKLIHNMMLGTMVAGLAEGMALAEKVGLDQEDLAEIFSLGSLNCSTINFKSQGQVLTIGCSTSVQASCDGIAAKMVLTAANDPKLHL
nr:hypothetical protein BaRGS_005092 [Batillaria attramentaria]